MTEEPVTYSSLLPYYILLFAVLIICSFAGIEVSSYLAVSLFTDQLLWYAYSLSILLAMAPILWLIARAMKRRVSFNPDMKWDFHTQEIQYSEYAAMMADYSSGYSHLISRSDRRILLGALALLAAAVILPALFAIISLGLVFIIPLTYGGLMLVYGILLTSYFYRTISNDASVHFLYENPILLKKACELLEETPGFSMVGVVFLIGESAGYYAFRSPAAIGRIAGIEAVAKVELTVGDISPPMTAFATVTTTEEDEPSKRMMELQPGNELHQLEGIVRWCVATYVEESGSNEILDELMAELGIDAKHNDESPPSID